jgi:hypothetical protein
MVYVYDEFALQARRFRVVYKGVLGLGLITMYCYYDVAVPGMTFRVV